MKDELHLHKALYELQEYRAIGTIEECRKAMELLEKAKQVKKKIEEIRGVENENNKC